MKVVITGSTKGIGLALALKFLEAGDDVVISSRNEARVQEVFPAGGKVRRQGQWHTCGVTSHESLERLAQFAGRTDIWVNNAAWP